MTDDPHPTTSLDHHWCSIAEGARRLGVTPTAIRNRIKRGTLEVRPNGNFGRLVRIPLPVTGTVPVMDEEPMTITVPITVPPTGIDEMADMLVGELRDRLQELQERVRAVDAERIELRHELAQERADAAQEREKMLAMIKEAGDRYDRLQAERDADLAQHRSEVDALRDELQRAVEQLRQPWWRKVFRAA